MEISKIICSQKIINNLQVLVALYFKGLTNLHTKSIRLPFNIMDN